MIEQYIKEIQDLRNQGFSFAKIARLLKLNQASLYSYCSYHRELFPKQHSYRLIDEDESKEIFDEYVYKHMHRSDIARKHNVCVETVNRHIRQQMLYHKIDKENNEG